MCPWMFGPNNRIVAPFAIEVGACRGVAPSSALRVSTLLHIQRNRGQSALPPHNNTWSKTMGTGVAPEVETVLLMPAYVNVGVEPNPSMSNVDTVLHSPAQKCLPCPEARRHHLPRHSVLRYSLPL